jgi:hypothetical protein
MWIRLLVLRLLFFWLLYLIDKAFADFFDGLADALGELGQLLAAKKYQDDGENDDELLKTYSKHIALMLTIIYSDSNTHLVLVCKHRIYLKRLSLLLLLVLLPLFSPGLALAATYGEGTYGGGTYNVGDTAQETTSGDSAPSSDSSSGSCSAPSPGKAPWLYAAVAKSSSSIELYFTNSGDPYDHYALEYGTSAGNYQWGATDIGGKGTRTYTVTSLNPNTTYYFRVRAGNDCATGEWSNELSTTTKGRFWAFSTGSLDTETIDVETRSQDGSAAAEEREENLRPGSEQETDERGEDQAAGERGYRVKIKVVDEKKEAVLGASVTLYSTPREATTDSDGVAAFDDVEPGEHRVVVAFNGQSGEQKINISGDEDTDEIDFTIQIRSTSPFTNPWVIGVIASLVLALFTAVALALKSRNVRA